MSGFEFGRAWLWPGLLLLPVVWALLWALFDRARRRVGRYGARASDHVATPLVRSLRLVLLLGLGLLCWMDPRYGEELVTVERRGIDLILCLDTSRSMLARDMTPTRLGRAKADIRAVLPELEGGDRVGLIAFAGDARLIVPLTHDVLAFEELLDTVDTDTIKKGGTDLAAALRRALDVADPDQQSTTAVLLLTDGEDLAGHGAEAAAKLAAEGIVVYTVGYGSTMGSKITIRGENGEDFLRDREGNEVVSRMDSESLRALAEVTGGRFVRAESMVLPLNQIHEKRLRPMQKRSYDAGEETGKQARYQWVLLPLLLLLLFEVATAGGFHRR